MDQSHWNPGDFSYTEPEAHTSLDGDYLSTPSLDRHGSGFYSQPEHSLTESLSSGALHNLEHPLVFGGSHDFPFHTALTNIFEQPFSAQVAALEMLVTLVKDFTLQHNQGEHLLKTLDETIAHVQANSMDGQSQNMVQEALYKAYDVLGPTLFTEGTNPLGFS